MSDFGLSSEVVCSCFYLPTLWVFVQMILWLRPGDLGLVGEIVFSWFCLLTSWAFLQMIRAILPDPVVRQRAIARRAQREREEAARR